MHNVMKATMSSLIVVFGIATTSSSAKAADIEGELVGMGGSGYQTGTAHVKFKNSSDPGSINGSFPAGHLRFLRTGGTSSGTNLNAIFVQATTDTFWSFCLEVNQSITNPVAFDLKLLTEAPHPGIGVDAITPNQANALRQLWHRYYDEIADGSQAAAFQLAIWEIVFDNPEQWGPDGQFVDLHEGANLFLVGDLTSDTTEARDLANEWLRSLSNAEATDYGLANLGALVSADDQDQLIELLTHHSGTGGGRGHLSPGYLPNTAANMLLTGELASSAMGGVGGGGSSMGGGMPPGMPGMPWLPSIPYASSTDNHFFFPPDPPIFNDNPNQWTGPDDDGTPLTEPVVPAPPALMLALFGIAACLAMRRRLLGSKTE
jgi:hypothetical protein